MDGVIADWVAGAAEIVGRRIDNPNQYYTDEEWLKIKDHKRMFRHLPVMPGADKMVALARRFRDDLDWQLLFLTALPHNNDIPWVFWDKMMWVQERYPDIPVHFGPYSVDKQHHCKPGDILVDDRPDNCEQWSQAGGRSVWVEFGNYQTALDEVEQLLYLEQLKNKKY